MPVWCAPVCLLPCLLLLLCRLCSAWKCMVGESCDALAQGRVMAAMSLSWGLGCVAGPTIGGLLAQPCSSWQHMPGCRAGGLLQARWVGGWGVLCATAGMEVPVGQGGGAEWEQDRAVGLQALVCIGAET